MNENEDIHRRYETAVKNSTANLATSVICNPYVLTARIHDFRKGLERLVEQRDEALARIQAVKVERRHLQTLTNWFVKAVRGYEKRDVRRALGRNPGCFGTAHPGKYCSNGEGWGDELCQACLAISPLLRED